MKAIETQIVVLDRDGVINRDSSGYIKSASEWEALPGSLEAIALLSRAGFRVVVASNQSGLGRGLFTLEDLKKIHHKMESQIRDAGGRLAGIFFCPHHPEENCDCRKPKPGLLRQIESSFQCKLTGHPVIGDSERDLEAARAVGARPILVLTGNGARTARKIGVDNRCEVFDDLAAAAHVLGAEAD
jgi:D-glycero-D-manno-heptose 1,7-bisphosphate phosphatase